MVKAEGIDGGKFVEWLVAILMSLVLGLCGFWALLAGRGTRGNPHRLGASSSLQTLTFRTMLKMFSGGKAKEDTYGKLLGVQNMMHNIQTETGMEAKQSHLLMKALPYHTSTKVAYKNKEEQMK